MKKYAQAFCKKRGKNSDYERSRAGYAGRCKSGSGGGKTETADISRYGADFPTSSGFCAVAFVGSELGGWVRWVAMAAILAGMLGAAPTVLSMFGLQSALIA